ncbi:MAG: DNA double-strand break repair nuclease NurA [bacterium]
MLKRDKLAQTVMATKPTEFFKNKTQQNSLLFDLWMQLACGVIKIDESNSSYSVLAVDGSQIYPDRHMSDSGCFLINTGACYLSYAPTFVPASGGVQSIAQGATSIAKLFSEPYLFFDEQVSQELESTFSPDIVDLKREELEFAEALQQSLVLRTVSGEGQDLSVGPETVNTGTDSHVQSFVCLLDGSLIFGQLENKPEKIQKYYLKKYLEILSAFHDRNILIASYISLPASKDLIIRLVKAGKSSELESQGLCDAQLMAKFLPIGHRTTLFCNYAKITEQYPDYLKPHFFYLNVGQEIVRIELPAWVAKNEQHSNFIAYVCLNQCKKGFGYPVALAEAHEQAVVKSADRDFFYHLIQRKSIELCKPVVFSQKILKKQGMGF